MAHRLHIGAPQAAHWNVFHKTLQTMHVLLPGLLPSLKTKPQVPLLPTTIGPGKPNCPGPGTSVAIGLEHRK